MLCNTVSVAGCKCVKCWGWSSFPSHLQLVVWEYAERRSRPTAAYLLWSSHGKQTGARAEARRGTPGAWPGGQHSVWQKHKHRGPPNPQGCTTAKHRPLYLPPPSHSQQQFVLETSILGSRNLTLLMLWFCCHILIKHNRNCAVLALMKHWGRWTEKRSSYSG